jgi:hypothetical protein
VDETPINIIIADTVIPARLADNATARDLTAQLPLTLTFKDFNQVEKVATLPRRLSTDGAPAGADPDVGDIGYWAPWAIWCSITVTSATGRASFASADSTARWS